MNLGKPIFILFAVFAFLSALWRGLPPFGLIETLLWGSLAWLWAKKDWKDIRLNYALLAVPSFILLGEGYRVGVVAGQQQTVKAALNGRSDKPVESLSDYLRLCGSSNTNPIDRLRAHCDDTPKLPPEKKPDLLPPSPAPIYVPDAVEPTPQPKRTGPKIVATIIGEDNSNAPCGGLILWNKPGYEADRRALARFKGGERVEYLGTDSGGTSWSSTIVRYHGMQGYIDFEACVVMNRLLLLALHSPLSITQRHRSSPLSACTRRRLDGELSLELTPEVRKRRLYELSALWKGHTVSRSVRSSSSMEGLDPMPQP